MEDQEQGQGGGADIAVIGMACRFPGAANPVEFWQLLQQGREARIELDEEALRAAGISAALLADRNYVRAGMFLEGFDQFDAGFFGFSPLDARIMDPQHRHFLECSWEALENAGYDPARSDAAIGVFAGSGHNAYLPYNLLTNPDLVEEVGFFLLRHTGNDKDFLATRASYCFDLKGPSVNVQTACSTSLVAIHNAAQSLLSGECEMALAGGVTIEMPHRQGYLFKESEILSPDGHCRPFDASSGGTVFGSGVGVLLLKRLDDALADGDIIHAVIKASAVNNDGAGKVSYLAPSVDGQAAAVQEALAIGEIDPTSVTYIECHGTGTSLGDPIEVAALTQAYGADNPRRQYCGIGSVKSNIGHLDTAAGVASLIKVILALQHRQLPATLHYSAPNPAIDFPSTPFYVNAELQPWTAASPLRAGVSSLGVGGTNAHLIVEEAPARVATAPGRGHQLLLLSGRTDSALQRNRDRLARWLEEGRDGAELADAAYTLAMGRRAFKRRGFVVTAGGDDAIAVLDGQMPDRFPTGTAAETPRQVAFMFAGGGAQYPNMGRGLYDSEPVYRDTVDECLRLLRDVVDFDLRPLLFPAAGSEQEAAKALERPSRTLPALFVTQYAQAQLWRAWGVEPAALIGHSMGENTAACLAGVLSLRDALGLVALRGRLFETVGEGSMLSVELDGAELTELLGDELSLAALNAPGLSVASGPKAALQTLEQELQARDIGFQRIHINVAAHSAMLEPILDQFESYLRSIRLQPPQIPFISNLSGDWIKPEQAMDPRYWVRHLRQSVRFSDGVGRLFAEGRFALLEVGPGRTLASLAGLRPDKGDHLIATSLRHPDSDMPDLSHMLTALGRMWTAGVEIDWSPFYADQARRRIPLPTYGFDHARHWVEPGSRIIAAKPDTRARETAELLYQPVWQRTAVLAAADLSQARVLVLAGAHPFSAQICRSLEQRGAQLCVVRGGDSADLSDPQSARIRWSASDDYLHLVDALRGQAWQPTSVLHLLALDVNAELSPAAAIAQRPLVFDSLIYLAQAVAAEDWQPLDWQVVTSQAVQVGGEALRSPLPTLALGAIRVFPREFPQWRTKLLDLGAAETDAVAASVVQRVGDELGDWQDAGSPVALRGNSRFVQHFQRSAALPATAGSTVREGGVYLITGGTGGLGLAAAEALAAQANITLVLVARRPLPERRYWDQLIAEGAPEAVLLNQLQRLELRCSSLLLEAVDIGDEGAVQLLAQRLPTIDGILHTAGVIDDGLLFDKEMERADRVLAPKLLGTLVLQKVFGERPLDFFAVYSSTSAIFGLPGQVDYAAANAFLDGFSHWRHDRFGSTLAIGWPAWNETGMAAALAHGGGARLLAAGRPVVHPLLDRCTQESDDRAVYATLFDVERHWLLSEHRIKDGAALIPGAGFIELARAAFADRHADAASIRIDDAEFLLPFPVLDHERKVLRVELVPDTSGGCRFHLVSDSFGDDIEHAHGRISVSRPEPLGQLDLASIRARCQQGVQQFNDADHHPFLDFGPRWQVLRQVFCGEGEALIELEFEPSHWAETEQIVLHPAALDMATAGAQLVIEGYRAQDDFYVPVAYRRLQLNGRFPRRFWSHVTCRSREDDLVQFDVVICDEKGSVFLTVDGFGLRRISDPAVFRQPQAALGGPAPALARTLELGLQTTEGCSALLQILAHRLAPQIVVSPYDLDYLQGELLPAVDNQPEQVRHDADADPEIPFIEQQLATNPALASVVVRSFLDAEGGRRLVAFFVPDISHYATTSEIRRHAREALSAEKMPQHLIELDELPVGSDGSVDRTALLDPLAPADNYNAPRTAAEKALARIWQDALGLDRVGLTDNFFDLGGHSLLSTRVIVQLNKRLGVKLDQATMVLHTLEQLAREIDNRTTPTAITAPVIESSEKGSKGMFRSLFGKKS